MCTRLLACLRMHLPQLPHPFASPTAASLLCPPHLQDTAAISTLRCLKLFLERMGAHHLDEAAMAAMAGRASKLVSRG